MILMQIPPPEPHFVHEGVLQRHVQRVPRMGPGELRAGHHATRPLDRSALTPHLQTATGLVALRLSRSRLTENFGPATLWE